MGGLGDHAGEMIYILLAILLIVAVMVIVMTLSKTAKKSTNQKTAELNNQVAQVDDQFFEDWDMNTASGAQVKQFLKTAQSSGNDCAVLIQTLSLLGNETIWKSGSSLSDNPGAVNVGAADASKAIGGVSSKTNSSGATLKEAGAGSKEATFNGTAFLDSVDAQLPVVMIDFVDANASGSHKSGGNSTPLTAGEADGYAFATQTALKTTIYNSCLVNYGSILKNAVKYSGESGENYYSILSSVETSNGSGVQSATTISAIAWDGSADKAQTIAYLDGRFHTKQEFAVSQSGIILTYDSTLDTAQSGKTMYISDTAKFNTYVLVDGADKYVGVVFIETK